ncbi:MAG: hypothetical protein ACFFG0_03905 [Candidatus Thorarchaeota archaeon]
MKRCEGCYLKKTYCLLKKIDENSKKNCPCLNCLVKVTCEGGKKHYCEIRMTSIRELLEEKQRIHLKVWS